MSENANEIKNAVLIDENPNARVEMAINKAMSVYLTRLKMDMINEGLEASFQMHLSGLLRDELELLTIDKHERFVVELEKNLGDKKDKNYVDICVEYHKNGSLDEPRHTEQYHIELKFKKKNQGAEPQNVIECFKDIYNLEQLANTNKEIKFCYFIFLTDHKLYTEKADEGIRKKFPIHHDADIVTNTKYNDDGDTAKNSLKKYPNGLHFKNNYKIKYQKLQGKDKNYYFFILSIPPKPSERAKC